MGSDWGTDSIPKPLKFPPADGEHIIIIVIINIQMYPGDLLSGFNGPCIVNTLKNMSGGRGADNGPIPPPPPSCPITCLNGALPGK